MQNNNRSNRLIMALVIVGDFLLLNMVIGAFYLWQRDMSGWIWDKTQIFLLASNMALLMSEHRFHTIIHERIISSSDILKRVLLLVVTQIALTYIILKCVDYHLPMGWLLLKQGVVMLVLLLLVRTAERMAVKWYRQKGGNTRTLIFVGADPELPLIYDYLVNDSTRGYKMIGYYADEEMNHPGMIKLGSLKDLLEHLEQPETLQIGDEMYVCLPRKEQNTLRLLSRFCDKNIIQFFYVPTSQEMVMMNLKRWYINDIEVFSTRENPQDDALNKVLKRLMDVVLSVFFLLLTIIIYPFVFVMIKIQSPGPVFFKQRRTGLNGKSFTMFKFRSMHVNQEADQIQASKDDPRKFPFGNFMRRTSLDELPQFWNVLMGDMSIVGPRPHMLAHTEMYAQLIEKYMVRHLVKPGITGWAQVNGSRGETKELWQMEERVLRDIWYVEHWSIWLDLRIIWMTIRAILVPSKNAY